MIHFDVYFHQFSICKSKQCFFEKKFVNFLRNFNALYLLNEAFINLFQYPHDNLDYFSKQVGLVSYKISSKSEEK